MKADRVISQALAKTQHMDQQRRNLTPTRFFDDIRNRPEKRVSKLHKMRTQGSFNSNLSQDSFYSAK